MSLRLPHLARGRVGATLPRVPTIARRTAATASSSVDDPSDTRMQKNRDGQRARGAPSKASAQELEPSLGSSKLLRSTPEEALATSGLRFADGHGLRGPTGKGRETRKMNLHQAVRDAIRTELATNPKSYVFGEDVKAHGVL